MVSALCWVESMGEMVAINRDKMYINCLRYRRIVKYLFYLFQYGYIFVISLLGI